MGMCLPCLGSSSNDYTTHDSRTPDPEDRRKQQAEAAERRMKEQEGRGVKNPERLKSQQRKREETERLAEQNVGGGGGGGGGLRWQVG